MRHEKVTIVLLAYIIGFTTAFIAFGIDNDGSLTKYSHPDNNRAQSQVRVEPKNNNQESVAPTLGSVVESDGLYALIDGQERVLSALAITANQPRDGFHYSIIDTDVSNNGQYIYYCAQQMSSDKNCLLYIYELSSDSVYRAKNDQGQQISLPVSDAKLSWRDDDRLMTGEYISKDSSKPWYMGTQ